MNDRLQRLRRDLTEAVAPPTCPIGYRVRTFAPDDAPTVHRLLEVAYAQGGGHIGPFEEWWPSLRDDDEFARDFVSSRSMSGRTLSESPNAGPVPSSKTWLSIH
jgi:hypothetical protein